MDNNVAQDTEEISLVCTLNDRELIERLQYLRDEIFTPDKISAIEELDDGFRYIYDQPVDFSLKLVEFINFERKCCQGFRFALEFEPEEGPINLIIYGSEQIRDILDGMIENSDLNTLIVRRS